MTQPNHQPPQIQSFDRWPTLKELFNHGGYLGVQYLYLVAGEEPNAQEHPTGPWYPTGLSYFRVKGVPMTVYARGAPIRGSGPNAGIPKCFVSKLAVERTGLAREITDSSPTMNEVLKMANKKREAIGLQPTTTADKTSASNIHTPTPKLPKLPDAK